MTTTRQRDEGMSECPRIGKLIGGCKFEPVYDTTPPALEEFGEFSGAAGAWVLLARELTAKKFRGAVCTRCGRVADQGSAP